jgi:tetrahydromethanopterin S-methyltransferase subunit G
MSKNKNTPTQKVETPNDLEQLRDILYGNQARVTEDRLNELETRLEAVNQELKINLDNQVTALSGSTDDQFKTVEEKLNQTIANFNQRLDQQISDLRKQISDFRAESRQRDNDLRQEMLTLGAMLDKQKTGRNELGDLLLGLGQQLKENSENKTDSE